MREMAGHRRPMTRASSGHRDVAAGSAVGVCPGGLQVQCLLEMPGRGENAGGRRVGGPGLQGDSWAELMGQETCS